MMRFLIKKTLKLFSILNEHNFKISATKSVFNLISLDFLGFHIWVDGIKPAIRKIEELNFFLALRMQKGYVDFLEW